MDKRICKNCGSPRPSNNVKYCDDCKISQYHKIHSKYSKKRYKNNSEKIKARVAAHYAKNVGKLHIIYECCCDTKKKFDHHFDYDIPNAVIRLCSECHREEHRRLKNVSHETNTQKGETK